MFTILNVTFFKTLSSSSNFPYRYVFSGRRAFIDFYLIFAISRGFRVEFTAKRFKPEDKRKAEWSLKMFKLPWKRTLPSKIHSPAAFQSSFRSFFLSFSSFLLKTYSREFPRFLIWYLLRIAFLTRRCRYFPELRGEDLPKRFKSKDTGIKLENQIARRKRNEIAIFPSYLVEETKVSLSLSLSLLARGNFLWRYSWPFHGHLFRNF